MYIPFSSSSVLKSLYFQNRQPAKALGALHQAGAVPMVLLLTTLEGTLW